MALVQGADCYFSIFVTSVLIFPLLVSVSATSLCAVSAPMVSAAASLLLCCCCIVVAVAVAIVVAVMVITFHTTSLVLQSTVAATLTLLLLLLLLALLLLLLLFAAVPLQQLRVEVRHRDETLDVLEKRCVFGRRDHRVTQRLQISLDPKLHTRDKALF